MLVDGAQGMPDWEMWFSIAGQLAMAGWVVLILAPRRWCWLNRIAGYGVPVVLSFGYSILILLYFAAAEGGFSSLASVAELFRSPPVLLAGWVHYLAFDLFTGGWIARRAERYGISRLVLAPILALTFLFGPLGLLIFMVVLGGQYLIGEREDIT